MSGEQYKYDLEDLTTVAAGLATLHGDFEHASRSRDEAHGALGYDDLQGAVRDFVDNWKHERGKQLEALEGSAEALGKIVDAYVEHDGTAAGGLRESSGSR